MVLMALSSSDSEADFLFWLSKSLTRFLCSVQFILISFLSALQNSFSSACFQLRPFTAWLGISSWGGPIVNVSAWWLDKLPISVLMKMFEREPKFEVDLLAKTKLMTEVWPLWSSLVGTFGSFMSLNEKPL